MSIEKETEYKNLYMIKGNSERSVDYHLLTKTYISYLSVFLAGEDEYKNFKGNILFINNVVNGFNYYQNKLFDGSCVDDFSLVGYINSKHNEILENSAYGIEEEKDKITDEVYKVTYACYKLVNRSDYQLAPVLIRQMFSNACNIESTFSKYTGKYSGM